MTLNKNNLITGIFDLARHAGDVINTFNPYSRARLNHLKSLQVTESDIAALRKAQEKRDRRAARNLRNSQK